MCQINLKNFYLVIERYSLETCVNFNTFFAKFDNFLEASKKLTVVSI